MEMAADYIITTIQFRFKHNNNTVLCLKLFYQRKSTHETWEYKMLPK